MVRSEGLEPPTPWFEAKYSIQLSYERIFDTRLQKTTPGFLIGLFKLLNSGGPYRIRTYDTEVKSLLLYQLS